MEAAIDEVFLASPWNKAVEDWLDDIGVTWKRLPAMKLAAIDKKRSRANQARIESNVDADQVAIFATAKRNGATFPALIAWTTDAMRLVVLADGNHRHEADEQVGSESAPAYLVENPTEAQIARLTLEANVAQGRGSTMRDRIHHAVHFHERWGISIKQACEQVGVPTHRVEDYLRERETEARLRELGAPIPASRSHLSRLASIRSDAVLTALAPLAGSLTTDQMSRLVSEVNRARSEAQALEVIAAAASDVTVEKKARPFATSRKNNPLQRLTRLSNLHRSLPSDSELEQIPKELQPMIRSKISAMADRLEIIVERLHP